MSTFSNYLENSILNHVFNQQNFAFPTGYVALSRADPGEAGAAVDEPTSASGYARVLCTGFTTASTGAIANSATITFPTATGPWGTITHFAIFDHLTTGNMLGRGALTTSKTPTTNDIVQFSAGALVISLD